VLAKGIFVLGLGLVVCGFSNRAVHAQAASSTSDGVYTAEQAQRGDVLSQANCTSCHGKALDGSGQTPPLTGDDFTKNWIGQTMDDLFEMTQTSMPADHPGKLTREQTADVLAFVLSSNKFPAGQAELPTDAESLKKIHIDAVPAKN
jgi:S-disulfanyl-L-cysteine oxidoreductase SoxD